MNARRSRRISSDCEALTADALEVAAERCKSTARKSRPTRHGVEDGDQHRVHVAARLTCGGHPPRRSAPAHSTNSSSAGRQETGRVDGERVERTPSSTDTSASSRLNEVGGDPVASRSARRSTRCAGAARATRCKRLGRRHPTESAPADVARRHRALAAARRGRARPQLERPDGRHGRTERGVPCVWQTLVGGARGDRDRAAREDLEKALREARRQHESGSPRRATRGARAVVRPLSLYETREFLDDFERSCSGAGDGSRRARVARAHCCYDSPRRAADITGRRILRRSTSYDHDTDRPRRRSRHYRARVETSRRARR